MAAAHPTICAHNAPGQVVTAGHSIECIKCGALIEASPRATSGGAYAGGQHDAINATYPGQTDAASTGWAFSQ